MARLLPLLIVVVLLTGCRETIVGPTPDPTPPPVPTAGVDGMYVKAPDFINEFEVVDVRAEPIEGAVLYDWGFTGPGTVALTPNDPYGRRRVLAAEGVGLGVLTITSQAIGADGLVIAQGSKTVEVVRY